MGTDVFFDNKGVGALMKDIPSCSFKVKNRWSYFSGPSFSSLRHTETQEKLNFTTDCVCVLDNCVKKEASLFISCVHRRSLSSSVYH